MSLLLRTFRPTSPSLRWKKVPLTPNLHKGRAFSPLLIGKRKTGGRNNRGHITAPHRGGGARRMIRYLDNHRKIEGPHRVIRIEYDPNRSARIALLKCEATKEEIEKHYPTNPKLSHVQNRQAMQKHGIAGRFSYILAPHLVKEGDILYSAGTIVHAISYKANTKAAIARSAGTYGQIVENSKKGYCSIRLASQEVRYLPVEARATIGVVSNTNHHLRVLGSAGAARRLGRRPRVRGMTMNAVDHAMGGGEAKTKGGKQSMSASGRLTKGVFTVDKSKNPYIITPRPIKNLRRAQTLRTPPGMERKEKPKGILLSLKQKEAEKDAAGAPKKKRLSGKAKVKARKGKK